MPWLLACLLPQLAGLALGAGEDRASARAAARLLEWRRASQGRLMDDWGQLSRHRADNARLGPPGPSERRVVFVGDSIVEAWRLGGSFPGLVAVNRGISGQTTPQMLVRFRQDVIALRPRAVVIFGSTNDVAGNTGPMSNEDSGASLASMAELAEAHGIRVVLAGTTPVHGATAASQDYFALRPAARLRELNAWMRQYAASSGHAYVDFHRDMADAAGLLRRELSEDGLHPNAAGYAVMAPLVESALRAVLASPGRLAPAPPAPAPAARTSAP